MDEIGPFSELLHFSHRHITPNIRCMRSDPVNELAEVVTIGSKFIVFFVDDNL